MKIDIKNVTKQYRQKTALEHISFELKKIGFIKSIIVTAVLSLPLIYIFLVSLGGPSVYSTVIKPSQKYYNTVRGEVNVQKYNTIVLQLEELEREAEAAENYSEYLKSKGTYGETKDNDIAILRSALSNCDRLLTIEETGEIFAENARNNLRTFEESDKFNIRYNKMVIKKAEKLSPLMFMNDNNQFAYCFGNTNYIFYLFPVFIILVCGIFTKEKESGMTALIQSTKLGKVKLFMGKYFAMLVTGIALTLYFQIFNFFGSCLTYGLQPAELFYSIRGVDGYYYTLYDFSILQFYIIITLMRMLGVIFVGTIIMIVSMISKNTIISACVSTVMVGILVGVPYYIRNMSYGGGLDMKRSIWEVIVLVGYLKKFLCTWILFPADYFMRFSVVNIFNFPVPSFIAIIVLCIFPCVVSAVIACRIYCGKT